MLNLHHLRYFRDAVRFGSLAESARRNRVTRPALSQAILSLENALGVDLLHHSKNAFDLTEEGRMLYERSGDILESVDSLRDDLTSPLEKVSGRLVVIASHSLAVAILPKWIARFSAGYPDVEVRLSTGNSIRTADALSHGEADLGLALDDRYLDGFQKTVLKQGDFVVAGLRGRKGRRQERRFLIGDKGEEVEIFRGRADAKRSGATTLMEVQSWEAARALALEGVGAALLPDFMLGGNLTSVEVGFKQARYSMVAAWRKNRKLSRAAEAFLRGWKP